MGVKRLVAVSGGVDSVVLLHMLKESGDDVIVAHFDHGIRSDSANDAQFVALLAKQYGLVCVQRREELGAMASEDYARRRRYAFLRSVAKEHKALLTTAHHADDVVETVAINLTRGTGWRGLAVLGAKDISRPLLGYSKQEIYEYAARHHLEWVEDSTNRANTYLRNRLRAKINSTLSEDVKHRTLKLWSKQQSLIEEINKEGSHFMIGQETFSRYFFTNIPSEVAMELFAMLLKRSTGRQLLRSQRSRGLLSIKTALPGAVMQLGDGVELRFTKDSFTILSREKML